MTTPLSESTRMKYKQVICDIIYHLCPEHIDVPNLCLLIDSIELYCYDKAFADINTLTRISDESKFNMYKSNVWLSCHKITPIFTSRLLKAINDNNSVDRESETDITLDQRAIIIHGIVEKLLEMPTYEYYDDMKKFADHTMALSAIEHTTSISIYTCPKCKLRDQTIRKKQTAAIDEAEKVIATCNQCNYMWIVF